MVETPETLSALIGHLGLEKPKITRIHTGYAARAYRVTSSGTDYFIKWYTSNSSQKYMDGKTSREIHAAEVDAIRRGAKVEVKGVEMPGAVYDTFPFIVQDFFKGRGFYEHIRMGKSTFRQFNRIGEFMARYHLHTLKGDTAHIIGDVNCNNFLFTDRDVRVIDPFSRKGSIYEDLAQFILTTYPVNFLLYLRIRNRYLMRLKQAFIEGYRSISEIDHFKLRRAMVAHLSNEREYLANDLIYRIKKRIINPYIHILIKRIENEDNLFT